MSLSRRNFVTRSAQLLAATSAASMIPGWTRWTTDQISPYAGITGAESIVQLADRSKLNALVLRAIDTARSAGASFADARVTRRVSQGVRTTGPGGDSEILQMGVRAFFNGVWGFASSPYCDLDEAVKLAHAAVEQAKINAELFPRDVDLGIYPVITGEWTTPIRIDALSLPLEERVDFMGSFQGLTPRRVAGRRYYVGWEPVTAFRTEKTCATTEGSLYTQTLYEIDAGLKVAVEAYGKGPSVRSTVNARGIDRAGAGWELLLDANLRDQIPGLIEEAERNLFLPVEPVTVGRYELVMDASTTGGLLAASLADATQLDRILGYEANAGGTSYFGPDYRKYLGAKLGNERLSLTADRSMPQGLATAKWDDEGVETESFPIIDRGIVVDYQTTRETAGVLKDWYTSQNKPVRSHGCSFAIEATQLPMLHTPNLSMTPGDGAASFEEMIANTDRGIAFLDGRIGTDFQSRSGAGSGVMREIRNGKLASVLLGAELLFDSLEVWKNLTEAGRSSALRQQPALAGKGEPSQLSRYSIRAVPTRFKDMAIVDGSRKA